VSNARPVVGLYGFGEHPFRSLETTRRFYLHALRDFELRVLEERSHPSGVDAVVIFWGAGSWPAPRDYPVLVALHGGAALGVQHLVDNLGRLDASDAVIVNCRADEDVIRSLMASPPSVLRLPLPIRSEFAPLPKREARRALPLPIDDVLIGFCGRLIPQKNAHRFLEMLAAIRRRLPHRRVQGLMIGDFQPGYDVLNYGDERYPAYVASRIEALGLNEDLIHFGGKLPLDALTTSLAAMDVLLHPTNTIDENFGYTTIEAMACGTPVVGCAYGGLKDTIVSGETGYLMDTWVTPAGIRGDYGAGVTAACRMIDDAALGERMARRAAEVARASYGIDACATILADGVRAAIARRRASGPRACQAAPPLAPLGDLLPPTDPPFAAYRPRCAIYASRATPRFEELVRVQAFGALTPESDGRYQVDDPLWPSLHRLEEQDLAILAACRDEVPSADLTLAGLSRAEIARRADELLAQGLLIGSAGDP
jgi:glycosyltransferase involved in cell wall biosynthesis